MHAYTQVIVIRALKSVLHASMRCAGRHLRPLDILGPQFETAFACLRNLKRVTPSLVASPHKRPRALARYSLSLVIHSNSCALRTDHAIFHQGLEGGCLSGVITVYSRQRGVVTLRFTSLPVISCKLVPYLSTSRVGLPMPKLLGTKLTACRSLYSITRSMCRFRQTDFTNSRLEGGRVIVRFLANQLSAEAKADVQAR